MPCRTSLACLIQPPAAPLAVHASHVWRARGSARHARHATRNAGAATTHSWGHVPGVAPLCAMGLFKPQCCACWPSRRWQSCGSASLRTSCDQPSRPGCAWATEQRPPPQKQLPSNLAHSLTMTTSALPAQPVHQSLLLCRIHSPQVRRDPNLMYQLSIAYNKALRLGSAKPALTGRARACIMVQSVAAGGYRPAARPREHPCQIC